MSFYLLLRYDVLPEFKRIVRERVCIHKNTDRQGNGNDKEL